jgi:DtxR family Mn-dependent transcriptional regulator
LPGKVIGVDRNLISQAMEDYLKAIYKLLEHNDTVSTSALAEQMAVAPASVTNMCKKLADLHLVVYEPYQGVKFTPAGKKMVLEIVRHHRLLELYLAEALGVPWDRVHEEAERLEHVISEDLEERMAAALGDPQFDPHGAPIPSKSGVVVKPASHSLTERTDGDRLVVVEVDDDDPELLRYLGQIGIYPGTEITLTTRAPFEGPLTINVNNTEHNLGHQAAQFVRVALLPDKELKIKNET